MSPLGAEQPSGASLGGLARSHKGGHIILDQGTFIHEHSLDG